MDTETMVDLAIAALLLLAFGVVLFWFVWM